MSNTIVIDKDSNFKSKKPEQKIHKETIEAPYRFTDPEKLDLGGQLAAVTTQINELEDRKKSVTSDFKAQIDGATGRANSLSGKLTAGFEMRQTECRVEFDAKQGIKTFFNLKTGEMVKNTEMVSFDYEQSLPMEVATDEVSHIVTGEEKAE